MTEVVFGSEIENARHRDVPIIIIPYPRIECLILERKINQQEEAEKAESQ